MFRVKIKASFR